MLHITIFMIIINATLEKYTVLLNIYQETNPHLVNQGKVFSKEGNYS